MIIFHHFPKYFISYYCIIFYTLFPNQFKKLAPNVPAVSDVFLRPMRKNAKHFYGRKKMWRSNTPQRGAATTGVLRSLAAVRRRTLTDLLGAGFLLLLFFIFFFEPFLPYSYF